MYAFGGLIGASGDTTDDTIEVYDMISNAWTTSPKKIVKPGSAYAITVGTEIWVFSFYGQVEIFDPLTESMVTLGDYPTSYKALGGKLDPIYPCW